MKMKENSWTLSELDNEVYEQQEELRDKQQHRRQADKVESGEVLNRRQLEKRAKHHHQQIETTLTSNKQQSNPSDNKHFATSCILNDRLAPVDQVRCCDDDRCSNDDDGDLEALKLLEKRLAQVGNNNNNDISNYSVKVERNNRGM